VRDGSVLPPDLPPLADPAVVAAHLPLRWVAELGVAGVAAGRTDVSHLLEDAWPAARPTVLELAETAPDGLRKAARRALTSLAAPPTARLELRLLGPVELRRDGSLVTAPEWRRERVRSLLAYLVLNHTATRDRIADDLWPALDAEGQSRNLRVTLTYLLRVLEPGRARRDASFFVRQHGTSLALHPATWMAADVWEFDSLCERAADADRQGLPSVALARALEAIDLWRGDPTEVASEAWAMNALEQRRLRMVAVTVRAGELLLARGSTEHAHTLAEQAVGIDPWHESAHRLVVATHSARHDAVAARRALVRYREAIGELGLSPDEATLMVERLLADVASHPDARAWEAPLGLRTPERRTG
jgi:LuxR family maltose regulon positive regulatory protein